MRGYGAGLAPWATKHEMDFLLAVARGRAAAAAQAASPVGSSVAAAALLRGSSREAEMIAAAATSAAAEDATARAVAVTSSRLCVGDETEVFALRHVARALQNPAVALGLANAAVPATNEAALALTEIFAELGARVVLFFPRRRGRFITHGSPWRTRAQMLTRRRPRLTSWARRPRLTS